MERLQEQLQQEIDRKSALESGLNMSKGNQTIPETTDEKVALLHFLPVLTLHIQLETYVFVS